MAENIFEPNITQQNPHKKIEKNINEDLSFERILKEEEIIDINPEISDKNPIFFAQGWGDTGDFTKEHYLPGISAGEKRRLLAVSFPHEDRIKGNIKEGEIPKHQLQRALAIIETLERKKVEKVNGVGYSQGGLDIALAASLRPDLFENLVFVNPAGIIGNDSFLNLVKRFVIDNGMQNLKTMKRKPEWKDKFKSIQESFKKYLFSNVAMAVKEVGAISQSDILNQVAEFKKQGIGVSFICSADDKVFEMARIQELMEADILDGFYSVKGGHSNLKFDNRVQALVGDAIKALEKKEAKEKEEKNLDNTSFH